MRNEVDEKEINRVIAGFMEYGWDYENAEYVDIVNGAPVIDFTRSLDALVPVWEKLEADFETEYDHLHPTDPWCFRVHTIPRSLVVTGEAWAKTIQLAAATATHKAILELNKEGE